MKVQELIDNLNSLTDKQKQMEIHVWDENFTEQLKIVTVSTAVNDGVLHDCIEIICERD